MTEKEIIYGYFGEENPQTITVERLRTLGSPLPDEIANLNDSAEVDLNSDLRGKLAAGAPKVKSIILRAISERVVDQTDWQFLNEFCLIEGTTEGRYHQMQEVFTLPYFELDDSKSRTHSGYIGFSGRGEFISITEESWDVEDRNSNPTSLYTYKKRAEKSWMKYLDEWVIRDV